MFPRVLSSVGSEQNPAHSGFCLGPGAGGRGLAPPGVLSGHKNVVPRSDFTFLEFILVFWCDMGKVDF